MRLRHPQVKILLTFICISTVLGERIMMFSVLGSRSTATNMQIIGEELAARGHQLILVFLNGAKPSSNPNLTYYFLPAPQLVEARDYSASFFQKSSLKFFPLHWYFLMKMVLHQCKHAYETPELEGLMRYKGQVDLVVFDALFHDCYLPVIQSLHAPIVLYHGNILEAIASNHLQIPVPLSYTKTFHNQHKPTLSFKDRILNTVAYQLTYLINTWTVYPKIDAIAKQLVPDSPGVINIIKNASLYMGIADTTWSTARPTTPVAINIACSHCRPPKQLPKKFTEVIVESGENGFIVFSMGTFFDPKYFPKGYLEEFFKAFSRLKQTVIWKNVTTENLPPNVKSFPWIPQQDLIGHPMARLCITHGGMYGLFEAMYHGIPILGIPIFGDQEDNFKMAFQKGSVLTIDKMNITADLLYETIATLIQDPKYKQKAIEVATRMQDQPETSLQRMIYWLEYVLRHKDVSHLQGSTMNVGFIEYFCLDVIFLIVLFTIIITVLPIALIASCIKKITKKS